MIHNWWELSFLHHCFHFHWKQWLAWHLFGSGPSNYVLLHLESKICRPGFLCRTTVLHLNAVFSQPLSKKLSFCALILAISQFWLKQHPCQLNLPKAQVDILKCLVLFLQNLKDKKKINVVIRMALSRAHTPIKPNSPAQFNQTYSKFKPA